MLHSRGDRLSVETIAKINDILKIVEDELQSPCLIKIEPFTEQFSYKDSPIVIGQYKDVEIYDALPLYKDIEGIYPCTNREYSMSTEFNFEWVARTLYWNERFSKSARYSCRDGSCTAGVCRKCGKYKTDDADTYFNLNNIGINDSKHTECQICGEDWTKYKYYGIVLDQATLTVYKYSPVDKKDMKMKLLVNTYKGDNKTEIIAKFRPLR